MSRENVPYFHCPIWPPIVTTWLLTLEVWLMPLRVEFFIIVYIVFSLNNHHDHWLPYQIENLWPEVTSRLRPQLLWTGTFPELHSPIPTSGSRGRGLRPADPSAPWSGRAGSTELVIMEDFCHIPPPSFTTRSRRPGTPKERESAFLLQTGDKPNKAAVL